MMVSSSAHEMPNKDTVMTPLPHTTVVQGLEHRQFSWHLATMGQAPNSMSIGVLKGNWMNYLAGRHRDVLDWISQERRPAQKRRRNRSKFVQKKPTHPQVLSSPAMPMTNFDTTAKPKAWEETLVNLFLQKVEMFARSYGYSHLETQHAGAYSVQWNYQQLWPIFDIYFLSL